MPSASPALLTTLTLALALAACASPSAVTGTRQEVASQAIQAAGTAAPHAARPSANLLPDGVLPTPSSTDDSATDPEATPSGSDDGSGDDGGSGTASASPSPTASPTATPNPNAEVYLLSGAGESDDPARGSTATPARYSSPRAVAYDGTALYVADTQNHVVRRIAVSGNPPVASAPTVFAGAVGQASFRDGAATTARFDRPQNLLYDAPRNRLLLTEGGGPRIRAIALPGGAVSTVFDGDDTNGTLPDGRPFSVVGFGALAVDPTSGTLFLSNGDRIYRRVFVADPELPAGGFYQFESLAGDFPVVLAPSPDPDDPHATPAPTPTPKASNALRTPLGVVGGMAFDATGRGKLFFSEPQTYQVRVVEASSGSLSSADPYAAVNVKAVAGTANAQDVVQGAAASSKLYDPQGLVYLSASNKLLIADGQGNNLRAVTAPGAGSGSTVSLFAGAQNRYQILDGTRTAAGFRAPFGLCSFGSAYVIVTDTEGHNLRRVKLP